MRLSSTLHELSQNQLMPNARSTAQSDSNPSSGVPDDFEYIATTDSLEAFLALVDSDHAESGAATSICAVDTEADSLHSYDEKLCLIQFASPKRFAIIDPLAGADLTALVRFMEKGIVWMHGADFDMRMIRRRFDVIPPVIYDTQTAARLLGYRRFGLAALVEDNYGVVLHKGSQKADWGQRPLPDKMLEYAVNDVRYLLGMGATFQERLFEAGRHEWFVESCMAARETVLIRPEKSTEDLWRVSGWGKLSPRGLSYLRSLWLWRDEEARLNDRPPFKILSNDQLLQFAIALEAGRRVELSRRVNRHRIERFEQAIEAARAQPESDWPQHPKRVRTRKDPDADSRFERMRAHRDRVAQELGIEGTLIASRTTLERLAALQGCREELLLKWQLALLQDSLPEVRTGGTA